MYQNLIALPLYMLTVPVPLYLPVSLSSVSELLMKVMWTSKHAWTGFAQCELILSSNDPKDSWLFFLIAYKANILWQQWKILDTVKLC